MTAQEVQKLNKGVQAEDSLWYSEPADWRIPFPHFPGQAYIAKGELFKRAEDV
jgi:hypothetical protein